MIQHCRICLINPFRYNKNILLICSTKCGAILCFGELNQNEINSARVNGSDLFHTARVCNFLHGFKLILASKQIKWEPLGKGHSCSLLQRLNDNILSYIIEHDAWAGGTLGFYVVDF